MTTVAELIDMGDPESKLDLLPAEEQASAEEHTSSAVIADTTEGRVINEVEPLKETLITTPLDESVAVEEDVSSQAVVVSEDYLAQATQSPDSAPVETPLVVFDDTTSFAPVKLVDEFREAVERTESPHAGELEKTHENEDMERDLLADDFDAGKALSSNVPLVPDEVAVEVVSTEPNLVEEELIVEGDSAAQALEPFVAREAAPEELAEEQVSIVDSMPAVEGNTAFVEPTVDEAIPEGAVTAEEATAAEEPGPTEELPPVIEDSLPVSGYSDAEAVSEISATVDVTQSAAEEVTPLEEPTTVVAAEVTETLETEESLAEEETLIVVTESIAPEDSALEPLAEDLEVDTIPQEPVALDETDVIEDTVAAEESAVVEEPALVAEETRDVPDATLPVFAEAVVDSLPIEEQARSVEELAVPESLPIEVAGLVIEETPVAHEPSAAAEESAPFGEALVEVDIPVTDEVQLPVPIAETEVDETDVPIEDAAPSAEVSVCELIDVPPTPTSTSEAVEHPASVDEALVGFDSSATAEEQTVEIHDVAPVEVAVEHLETLSTPADTLIDISPSTTSGEIPESETLASMEDKESLVKDVEAIDGVQTAVVLEVPPAGISPNAEIDALDLSAEVAIPKPAIERPKSPWTPSYTVTRQGSGLFNAEGGVIQQTDKDGAQEEEEEDYGAPLQTSFLPPEDHADRPTTPIIVVRETIYERADETAPEVAPTDQDRPKSPWTPSYTVMQQGASPTFDNVPEDEIEPIEPMPESMTAVVVEEAPEPIVPESVVSIEELGEAPLEPEEIVRVETGSFIIEGELAHEISVASTPAVEPALNDDAELSPVKTGSFIVDEPTTTQVEAIVIQPEPVGFQEEEEVSSPVRTGSFIIEDGAPVWPSVQVVDSASDEPPTEAEITEDAATTPERPRSPWTPSYTVTRQGSGVFNAEERKEPDNEVEETVGELDSTTAPAVPEIKLTEVQELIAEPTEEPETAASSDPQPFPSKEPTTDKLEPVAHGAPRARVDSVLFPGGWFSSWSKPTEQATRVAEPVPTMPAEEKKSKCIIM